MSLQDSARAAGVTAGAAVVAYTQEAVPTQMQATSATVAVRPDAAADAPARGMLLAQQKWHQQQWVAATHGENQAYEPPPPTTTAWGAGIQQQPPPQLPPPHRNQQQPHAFSPPPQQLLPQAAPPPPAYWEAGESPEELQKQRRHFLARAAPVRERAGDGPLCSSLLFFFIFEVGDASDVLSTCLGSLPGARSA